MLEGKVPSKNIKKIPQKGICLLLRWHWCLNIWSLFVPTRSGNTTGNVIDNKMVTQLKYHNIHWNTPINGYTKNLHINYLIW